MEQLNIGREKTRKIFNMDRDWRFTIPGDPAGMIHLAHGREYIDYDDSAWELVGLPHDYMLAFPVKHENSGNQAWREGALGWYRLHFEIQKSEDKSYTLQIDGAYRNAELWVNGEYVCIHKNGFFSFAPEITAYLRDGKNLIAIRTDNLDVPNCRWYSGAGLYRHVKLVETGKTCIPYSGIAITTPEMTAASAVVHVEAEVQAAPPQAEMAFELFGADGNCVASGRAPVRDGRALADLSVAAPRLWSPDTPYLYELLTTVWIDGEPADDLYTTFGIRKIEYRKGEGFFLNGVMTKFKGLNLHADGGPMGHAIPESFWEYRLRQIKALGCNAIGLSHCPHAPEFLDLCDRMGFLVNSEYADKWEPPFYVDFYETWNDDLTGWMRRDRNHPCVVMWSLGCENNEPGVEYLDKRLEMFTTRMREIDTTRPICSSLDRGHDIPGGRGKQIVDTCRSLDLIGVNYAEQWFEDMIAYAPDALLLGTESYMYFTSEHEKRLTQTEMNPWLKVLEDDRYIGQFKWVGIDYLGEASLFWPKQGLSSGIFDMVGTKKPQAYLMESFWSDKPMVCAAVYRQDPDRFVLNHILDQWECPLLDFNWHVDAAEANVATYTNCETVQLWLNGKLIGEQRLADIPNRIMKWQLPYEAGELVAVGRNGGKEAARFTLRTAGEPKTLELKPYLTRMRADRADITLVEIRLLDVDGVQCMDAADRVAVSVDGAGTLERVGSGDLTNHDSFFDASVRLYEGKAVCFVRAKAQAGTAVVKVTAPNGISAQAEIQIG